MIKEFLKKKLSVVERKHLENTIKDVKALFTGRNLNKLGRIYKSDKAGDHNYTPHYMTHFKKFRCRKVKLFEIGVGGYENPYWGGESLRMWRRYFPFGKIFSIDIYEKSVHQEKRIKIFKGSQVDRELLNTIFDEIGEMDIIIDDGSHLNEHVIESFKILFPKVKDGGIYVIEDTQTSYWEDHGGNSTDLNNPNTMMNFFKGMADSLNNQEFILPGYQQSYYDKNVISLHFYHNLIFVYKGNNDEKSNAIFNNQKK